MRGAEVFRTNFSIRLSFTRPKVFRQSFQTCQNFFLGSPHFQKKDMQKVKCIVHAKEQEQKTKMQSKSKVKSPLCALLRCSENSFCKQFKKLTISSSSPHHHHFMLSTIPTLPSKIPKPPPPPMNRHDNIGKKKLQLVCEAVAIRRGGVSGPVPAIFPSDHDDF